MQCIRVIKGISIALGIIRFWPMKSPQVHRLVLHPGDISYAIPSWKPIIETLQTAQLVGECWRGGGREQFLVGDRFLSFITFMGCSPYIVFEPPPDGSLDFCHIQFNPIHSDIQFRCASQNVFARCPQCRKRINNFEPAIAKWRVNSAATAFYCDKCGAEISLYQLGWRHTGGFARLFLDIYSIYPQEGVPTDPLLALLEKASGTSWRYFYSDQ